MIVTDINKLKNKCKNVTLEEGLEIGNQLIEEIKNSNGIGLAANQIGIDANVCLIKVKEPIILINPEITEASEEKFVFLEGCLSFPDQTIKTIRHKSIKVKSDNHSEILEFSVDNDKKEKKQVLTDALETTCVQHEIDHLNGITMFDRKFVLPKRVSNKIGRNEKVLIAKGDESKVIKYKKAKALLDDGWTLVKQ